jgi:hypothetical protein
MIFGNLSVERNGELTVLQLNTYHKGVPRALMTKADIANLVAYLKADTPAPKPKKKLTVIVDDDDFNVEDLI